MAAGLCSVQAFAADAHAVTSRGRVVVPRAMAADRSDRPCATGAGGDGTQFLRPHLLNLAPYKPILPFHVLSAKLQRRPEEIIKLDANENPYGPPPEVARALATLQYTNIYPDPSTRRLRGALATLQGVPTENLMVGAGADELIDFLMRCVLEADDVIVDCPPTFTMYAFDAAVNAARVVTVPRAADFGLDVAGIRAAVEAHRPKLLFLTSPNNPDGSIIPDDQLLELLQLPVLVVFDEAYIDFADVPSKIPWVLEHSNLVVLRTFSKCAALAGMRVGYGAFPLAIAEVMWRAKQPYNVTVASEVAALAALSNGTYINEVRDLLVAERERLIPLLAEVTYLSPLPSQANFILCRVSEGVDGGAVRDVLAQRYGIMIRHYTNPELRRFIRVSVGKPEQSDALLRALHELAGDSAIATRA